IEIGSDLHWESSFWHFRRIGPATAARLSNQWIRTGKLASPPRSTYRDSSGASRPCRCLLSTTPPNRTQPLRLPSSILRRRCRLHRPVVNPTLRVHVAVPADRAHLGRPADLEHSNPLVFRPPDTSLPCSRHEEPRSSSLRSRESQSVERRRERRS